MVAEHVLRRHALADGVVLHGQHLVVRFGAVVAAHDDFRGRAGKVECYARVQTVLQNARGRAVRQNRGAQNHDGVRVEGGGRFGAHDGIARHEHHGHVRGRQHERDRDHAPRHHVQHAPHPSLFLPPFHAPDDSKAPKPASRRAPKTKEAAKLPAASRATACPHGARPHPRRSAPDPPRPHARQRPHMKEPATRAGSFRIAFEAHRLPHDRRQRRAGRAAGETRASAPAGADARTEGEARPRRARPRTKP